MCMYVCMNVCALSLINWINEKSIIRWVEWLRETNEKKGALYLFSQPQAPNFLYLVLFCFLVFCFTLSFIIFTDLSFPCPCLVMSSPLLYCTVLYYWSIRLSIISILFFFCVFCFFPAPSRYYYSSSSALLYCDVQVLVFAACMSCLCLSATSCPAHRQSFHVCIHKHPPSPTPFPLPFPSPFPFPLFFFLFFPPYYFLFFFLIFHHISFEFVLCVF